MMFGSVNSRRSLRPNQPMHHQPMLPPRGSHSFPTSNRILQTVMFVILPLQLPRCQKIPTGVTSTLTLTTETMVQMHGARSTPGQQMSTTIGRNTISISIPTSRRTTAVPTAIRREVLPLISTKTLSTRFAMNITKYATNQELLVSQIPGWTWRSSRTSCVFGGPKVVGGTTSKGRMRTFPRDGAITTLSRTPNSLCPPPIPSTGSVTPRSGKFG
mmetsp:Transcript_7143/g.17105  ORF Transcript_7143/g.17105 Transcript_7143/m.17105 type:complete len:215 (-) Transcript_7143:780-1424(-)